METEQIPFTKLKQRGLGHFLRGICMGTADVIPGVSGATIAMITGIYDELIATVAGVNTSILRSVAGGRFLEALTRLNAGFLVPLLAGVAVAFLSLAELITYLLVTHPKPLWGFFTGLVLAGALFVARHIKAWNLVLGLALVLGVGIGYGVTVLVPMETGTETYKFVLAGMIAIVAMILPGISGSFLLVIMGKYGQVMRAVHEFDLGILIFFGIGFSGGILAFSRVLKFLLARYQALTMTLLVGLMAGSVRRVWPFKRYQDADGQTTDLVTESYDCILPDHFDGEAVLTVSLMLVGIAAVLALERLGRTAGVEQG